MKCLEEVGTSNHSSHRSGDAESRGGDRGSARRAAAAAARRAGRVGTRARARARARARGGAGTAGRAGARARGSGGTRSGRGRGSDRRRRRRDDRLDAVRDGRGGDTVRGAGERVSSGRCGLVGSSVGVRVSGAASNVDAGVELVECRSLSVALRVQTRGVSSVALAGLKDLVSVVAGHDEVAAHDVELVLALEGGGSLLGTGDADTEADLVVRDVVHPLLVEDIRPRDVGGDIAADGVAHVGSTVGVELTTLITSNETNLGEVTERHELDVKGGLDEVSSSDSSVGLRSMNGKRQSKRPR